MSNFYLLKFTPNTKTIEDGVHLTAHSDLLDYLNQGYRMCSMEEWDGFQTTLSEKPASSEDSDIETEESIELGEDATLTQTLPVRSAEEVFENIGEKARQNAKPKKEWVPKHIWLLEKLIAEATAAKEKFASHEANGGSELTRREAVRMGHEVHLLAGKVADAIMNAKPRERASEAPYKPGDEITLNVLVNGLDNQCSGLAGKKMVKILWDRREDSINAIEFIARAYSHNDGKGNPFKPNTGYIARINAAWKAAGIPVQIDASDLNGIKLDFEVQ